MRPQVEMDLDIKTLLNEGMELNVWQVSSKNQEAIKELGAYGAAFYYEDEPPQTSDDAEYASTPLEAIEKALKRWR